MSHFPRETNVCPPARYAWPIPAASSTRAIPAIPACCGPLCGQRAHIGSMSQNAFIAARRAQSRSGSPDIYGARKAVAQESSCVWLSCPRIVPTGRAGARDKRQAQSIQLVTRNRRMDGAGPILVPSDCSVVEPLLERPTTEWVATPDEMIEQSRLRGHITHQLRIWHTGLPRPRPWC